MMVPRQRRFNLRSGNPLLRALTLVVKSSSHDLAGDNQPEAVANSGTITSSKELIPSIRHASTILFMSFARTLANIEAFASWQQHAHHHMQRYPLDCTNFSASMIAVAWRLSSSKALIAQGRSIAGVSPYCSFSSHRSLHVFMMCVNEEWKEQILGMLAQTRHP